MTTNIVIFSAIGFIFVSAIILLAGFLEKKQAEKAKRMLQASNIKNEITVIEDAILPPPNISLSSSMKKQIYLLCLQHATKGKSLNPKQPFFDKKITEYTEKLSLLTTTEDFRIEEGRSEGTLRESMHYLFKLNRIFQHADKKGSTNNSYTYIIGQHFEKTILQVNFYQAKTALTNRQVGTARDILEATKARISNVTHPQMASWSESFQASVESLLSDINEHLLGHHDIFQQKEAVTHTSSDNKTTSPPTMPSEPKSLHNEDDGLSNMMSDTKSKKILQHCN